MHWMFPLLLVATLVFGASYAATIITGIMGPWGATAVERDGSLTQMQFDANLPRPGWLPLYPGAWVVQASKLVSARAPSGFHSFDIGTRASLEDVRRFYTEALAAAEFEVTDTGTLNLNPATAAMLGIAGSLSARRASTDDQVDIQIRTPDGLIPSRLLQIHWRKISEMPALPTAKP